MPGVARLRDPGSGRFVSRRITRFTHRFKGGEVDVTLNTAAVRIFCDSYRNRKVREVAEAVEQDARQRVAPGVGPGPHPHRTPHEDTGRLQSAMFWSFEMAKNFELVSALVGVDATVAPYGVWLELGFHSRSGAFYKYPFLRPAFEAHAGGLGGSLLSINL